MATTRINLQPALLDLCSLENSCPPASVTEGQKESTAAAFTARSRKVVPISTPLTSIKPGNYSQVIEKIKRILDSNSLPTVYRQHLVQPLYDKLISKEGKKWFENQLKDEEDRPLENVILAIFQNFSTPAEGGVSQENAAAAQEAISDLFQDFMQRKCHLVDRGKDCKTAPSPLPFWTQEDISTYPRIRESLDTAAITVNIVNVPARYATRSAIAWGTFGHEVSGHDILGQYPGALEELQEALKIELKNKKLDQFIPHWLKWMNEATSDVLSILHLGPAGAFSMIGFLKALGENRSFKLANISFLGDEHPVDLLRAFVVKAAVNLLPLTDRTMYTALIEQTLANDLKGINEIWLDSVNTQSPDIQAFFRCHLKKHPLDELSFKEIDNGIAALLHGSLGTNACINNLKNISRNQKTKLARSDERGSNTVSHDAFLIDKSRQSAELFAQVVMTTPLKALGGKSFSEIRAWKDKDEKIANTFRKILLLEDDIVDKYKEGCFGSHVVSAAIMESISDTSTNPMNQARLQSIFKRMISILNTLHKTNSEWTETDYIPQVPTTRRIGGRSIGGEEAFW
ncbi:MAG: hypothetical protein JSS10_03710 [Verrucomicrobia bacterium]|nr:hypothetical protein [Verrucomicrobiota bacterium]